MANREHLEILKQGVETWNQWREENPKIRPDLRGASLSGFDLSGFDLREANLNASNLGRVMMTRFDIFDIIRHELIGHDIIRTSVIESDIIRTDLTKADLTGADLRNADLRKAYLRKANLSGANLSGTDLSRVQMLGTHLEKATLTGACIQDWNTNTQTNFKNIKCDYIFLKSIWNEQEKKYIFIDRQPHQKDKIFELGDFEKLVVKSQETIDLIFRNGIDWQAFLNSYEQLKVEAGGDFLPIEAIENKGNGTFIVRIQAPPELDKGKIQKSFEAKYKRALKIKEQQYREKLNAKDREIEIYKEQNANLNNLAIILANQPITFNNMNSNEPRNETHNSTFNAPVSGYANVMRDNSKIEANQYNYSSEEKQSLAEAAAEIQELLNQLSETYSNPEEAKQKTAEELATKARQNPSFKEILKNLGKFVGSKAGETAITESVKQLVPIALALLV